MTSVTGVSELGSDRMTTGTDNAAPASVAIACVTGCTTTVATDGGGALGDGTGAPESDAALLVFLVCGSVELDSEPTTFESEAAAFESDAAGCVAGGVTSAGCVAGGVTSGPAPPVLVSGATGSVVSCVTTTDRWRGFPSS